jgi:hypothetical protein
MTAALITPEARSGLWKRLAALAAVIRDAETKAQYLSLWRSRFDEAFPPAPPGLDDDDMLPDGRQASVSSLGERDAKRLKSVAAAWLLERPNGRRKRRRRLDDGSGTSADGLRRA